MQTPTSLSMLEVKGMTTSSLLQELFDTFPPINPTPAMTMEQIMYQAGQRSIVEWIQSKMDES
jgi:hypothetical protein